MIRNLYRRCFAVAAIAAALLSISSAKALNIVWVSDNPAATTGFSGPIANTPDDAFITNLLWSAGHNVIRFNPPDASATALTSAELAALNTNDLVIVGRAIASGAFASQQANSWNQGVTKPMIVCSPFLTRTANLGWFSGTSAAATASPTTLTLLNTNDLKTAYLFQGFGTTNSVTTNAYDEAIDRNTSVTSDPTQGGGVIYARSVKALVGAVIADWQTGAVLRSGTNTLAGYRMYLACGSQEPSTGSSIFQAGKENLTAMGEQVFLRAVLLAANNGLPPNLVYDPIVIQDQPASRTNAENSTATFTVTISQGTLPRYQWYSNDVAVAGATTNRFSVIATPSAVGSYYVIITNNAGSVTSSVASLTVVNDTTPPAVLGVRAVGPRTVVVYFSEPVDAATATDFNRYYIDTEDSRLFFPGLAALSGNTAVVLSLIEDYPTNLGGSITINDIRDRAVAANSVSGSFPVSPYPFAQGNIVWVSDNGPVGFSGPVAGTEDDVFTTNVLANAGYNVIRFNGDNVATTLLTSDQIVALNTNDLIILGRSSTSGPYLGAGQGSQWNTNITKPVIVMSAYLSRSTALGWFTNDSLPDDTQTPLIGNTNSALFPLLFSGIAMDGAATVDSFDRPLDRNTTLAASAPVAGGLVLATAAENGATAIAQLRAGTAVRSGADTLSGYRMLFCGGSREANGANINTAGKNNFTAIGELIFQRALRLAIDQGAQPGPVVNASFSGGAFSAAIPTRPAVNYQIQYKTDLLSPSWTPLTNIIGDGTLKSFSDPAPVDPARYYRAIVQ
jgi:hypothetical protein